MLNLKVMILSGKELSTKLREKMKDHVKDITKVFNDTPCLAVILVGDDPASQSYVKGKSKACEEIGIINKTITLPSDITEQDLIKTINELNLNPHIHGILVQLPLPDHIDEHHIMNCIAPEKDVDGFHPMNVDALYTNKFNRILPCTPKGIIHLLNDNNIQIAGKNAVVIGRSNIVGLPIAKLLLDNNATVTVCHSKTKDLVKITSEADILIVAIGKPKFVKAHMIKPGAVVIDVGVNRVDGKLVGDVDFNDVAYRTGAITPVPGGVGPMTITCLMENTIECFLKQHI
jgi:methylenetetrahydrofolate dehydrogenase (NADP+)/methenyltetrahydrofolate cyclohydrolase